VKLETRVGLFILAAIGIFIYLSINIRALRLDKDQYFPFKAYFDDTSGLAVKAPVKIAGVEIGWVETIELLEDGKAEVLMRIGKHIKLAKNAFAMIHQDGLIGTKTLEIDPGDPSTGFLLPGSTLAMPGRTPASVGELMDQFRDIATTIQDIAASFKNVFATRKGEEQMRETLNSVSQASDRIANFAEVLQRTMANNEDHINAILTDFRATMPSLSKSVDNFGDASRRAADALDSIGDASVQARETFREAGEVTEKVNSGKGVLGKLINEDETYYDIKKTVRGFKEYVTKSQGLMLNIDMHSETMLRHYNSKGYFELRLRPNSDFFYLVQLVGDQYGSITRDITETKYTDGRGNVLSPTELPMGNFGKLYFAESVKKTVRRENDILFGLQFGKRFDRLAFRVGLFESSVGAGVDYYVPLHTDNIHWITTLEAFDFRGIKRIGDQRPHLKWLNKLFFFKNFYTTFGLDDIVSKNSANPFFGGGIRFGDDDLKYFFSYLPVTKMGATGSSR